MNCELCKLEMYNWRPDVDVDSFEPLFEHIQGCEVCAREFERLTSRDEAILRTFRKVPEAPLLESRILAGLAHERALNRPSKNLWWVWFLAPIAAMLLLVATFYGSPLLKEHRLGRNVALLLMTPPALQINSSDRDELLRWSADVLSGPATLPSRLNKVQFRGAATVNVADHKAVLLKMKNEERASLLIVNSPVIKQSEVKSLREGSGSIAFWSDPHRTYVLLFHGSPEDMHAYMNRMGITS